MRREYNRAMDRVHMSEDCAKRILEQASSGGHKGESSMKYTTMLRRAATVAVAAVVVSATALATDAGGIRTSVVTMWMNGQQQEVELEQNGDYEYTATVDGEERGFGGMSIDEDGNVHPLDEADIQDMYAIDVQQEDDGTWTLYFYDQTIDITADLKNGGYDETLTYDGTSYHVEVEPDGSYSVSADDEADEEADTGTKKSVVVKDTP